MNESAVLVIRGARISCVAVARVRFFHHGSSVFATFAALRSDTEHGTQVLHGSASTTINRLLDLNIGYSFADAYVHDNSANNLPSRCTV